MKILVSNDDGITADGLWALADELRRIGNVTVMAPHQEQSGVGTGISLKRNIRVNKVKSRFDDVAAFSVEGTPADGVILALRGFLPEKIDLVVSGINRGPNMGHDVYVSGTIGAAVQGYLYGIPAIAASLNGYDGHLHFEPCAKLVSLLATKIRDGLLPKNIFLNVNVPNLPVELLEGIEVTDQSDKSYCNAIEQDGENAGSYRIRRVMDLGTGPSGTDLWALQSNRISITPLLDGSMANPIRSHLERLLPFLHRELGHG